MMNAEITVNTGVGDCLEYFIVEYQEQGTNDWHLLEPNPAESPFVIQGLDENKTYDGQVRIKCCDGSISIPSSFTINN